MNAKNKNILVLGFAFLSILLLVFSSPVMAKSNGPAGKAPGAAVHNGPVMAKEQASRRQPARDSRSDDRDRDHASTGLSISFGLGSDYSNSANRRWVPGYYETRTERVLVEPGQMVRYGRPHLNLQSLVPWDTNRATGLSLPTDFSLYFNRSL